MSTDEDVRRLARRVAALEQAAADTVRVEVDPPEISDADREAVVRAIGVIEERLLGLDGRSDEVWRKRVGESEKMREVQRVEIVRLQDQLESTRHELGLAKATIKQGETRVESLRKALDDEKQERNRIYAELVAMTAERDEKARALANLNGDGWRPW